MTLHDRTHPSNAAGRRPAVIPEALEARQLFADVVATLAAPHDTFARDGSFAGQNYGTSGELVVAKTGAAGGQRQAFVRFDVGPASSGAVTRAVLRLYGKAAGVSGTATMGVSLLPVTQTGWTETGVTWNNCPAGSVPGLGSKTVGTTAKWVEYDVTAYVAAQRKAGNARVAFSAIAAGTSGGVASFASSEAAANRRALVVTTGSTTPTPVPPVPPPPLPPPVTVPAIPTGLAASVGGVRVRLDWQPAAGATSYVVYRLDEASAAAGQPLARYGAGVIGTTFTDTGAAALTGYRYAVAAVNAAGESGASAPVTAVTGTVPLARPTVQQASPAGLGVQVGAGTVTLPSGAQVAVPGGYLSLAAPPVQSHVWTNKAPPNHAGQAAHLRWPDNSATSSRRWTHWCSAACTGR